MIIKDIKARIILDSRGKETIQVRIESDKGIGIGSAPSGESTGKKEVVALPKNPKTPVDFLNNFKKLRGLHFRRFEDLKKVEDLLQKYDKTKNWAKIGGNTVIAVEYAILRSFTDKPWFFLNQRANQIPRLLGNCVGGGKHGKNGVDFQEFLVCYLEAKSYKEVVDANFNIYNQMNDALKIRYDFDGERGMEGEWTPKITNLEILDMLKDVVDDTNAKYNVDVRIGLDVAASSFFQKEYYSYKNYSPEQKNKELTREEHIDFICTLVKKYNLFYVEDPVEENDFDGFAEILKRVGDRSLICGDDLICTNPFYLKKAIQKKAVNAVIVKPNQIGSLIKTKEVVELAHKHNIAPLISHRAGETLDPMIAHLGVAFASPLIKCGIYGKERESKINELFKIESQIKELRGV